MDHLGSPGDHAERDGGLVGQPGGDHHVLLASHGSNTCAAAGVPPKEEMAALWDWQNKGDQPEVGQMAFHYSSAEYAASIKIKSLIWGAASKLTDQLSWEAIPKEELDKARAHGLAETERLLRQDRQPIWASSQKFQEAEAPEVVAAVHGSGREGLTGSRCSGLTSYAGSTEWQGADCHVEEWEGHLPGVSDR